MNLDVLLINIKVIEYGNINLIRGLLVTSATASQ